MHDHRDAIDWPNGNGYTPCTVEYRTTMDERDAIYRVGERDRTLDDLSPEDYQRWMVLDNKLGEMLLAGHVGESVRY